MRLDIYITQNYNIQSRNKANELIKAKKIKVNGDIITKASFKILSDDVKIEILEDDFYVSRSAYKLKYFIEELSEYNCKDYAGLSNKVLFKCVDIMEEIED